MTYTGRVIPVSWRHFALENVFTMIHSNSDGRGERIWLQADKRMHLLSSDEVRDITVLGALRRCCCFVCVCVCARARAVFFRRAGDGRTDWRCLNAIDVERRIGAAILLPRFCRTTIRWLDGIFNSVFDCFRPCFWTSCFCSLSLMGMFHAIGVTGDSVSVKCWLHTLECCLFLDMYYVVWISDVFYFPCASSYFLPIMRRPDTCSTNICYIDLFLKYAYLLFRLCVFRALTFSCIFLKGRRKCSEVTGL